ncbi:putative CD80-like C2-set and Ig-3 immunoglobulin domains-containing protein [Homarus americanus]|uniref:Putative CD80-like C2-set and Ig-3 immunoglobulin domains-containing protein n=1 Tax=Homarus americanus TaxID=6706 RepID=A0A8J5MKQ5_HOMAM|nr:putative CD80-like C2-set and Ig-3 immunoglobulin domains-containing protein [Homarus americanus]
MKLDLRESGDKEVYADPDIKGRVRSELRGSYLTLDPLLGSDAARYKCRVDFQDGPTRSALVNLTVYVVPSRLVVQDENSRAVPAGSLGPLTEGDKLTLYCVATGGRPPPKVTWWRGNHLLANRSLVLGQDGTLLASQEVNGGRLMSVDVGMGVMYVRTELTIPELTRDYARANLTCKASNNNITEALSTTISLDLIKHLELGLCQPQGVHDEEEEEEEEVLEEEEEEEEVLEEEEEVLEEEVIQEEEEVLERSLWWRAPAKPVCVASGAYPSASILWEKTQGGKTIKLKGTVIIYLVALLPTFSLVPLSRPLQSRVIGDTTSSHVSLVPEASDHGAKLTCRAHNPNISVQGVHTSTVLQVTCKYQYPDDTPEARVT